MRNVRRTSISSHRDLIVRQLSCGVDQSISDAFALTLPVRTFAEGHMPSRTVIISCASRTRADAGRRDGGVDGRQCAGGAGRQPLDRPRQARTIECRSGNAGRKIIEGLGLDIATADETREILELMGGDKVAF